MTDQIHEPVYKQLSNDMREGLKGIYLQITQASKEEDSAPSHVTSALFLEATSQLSEVLKSTEEATTNILEIVERNELNQEESAKILAELKAEEPNQAKLARLEAINKTLGEDLMNLTLQLSFQDLTGQRIKRVVSALNKIEESVVSLYIKSGLIMEGAENAPEKDAMTLAVEAEQAMEEFCRKREEERHESKLKGPDKNGISQNSIDDMLAQLGL